ncbi:MAG: alginate lyase family protein [Alphaproteobacteria bacterium]
MAMNTAVRAHPAPDAYRSEATIFTPPYDTWAPADILEHYRRHTSRRYFPVPDEGETRRDKIDGVLSDRFDFNNETHHLPPPTDWLTNPSRDLEWQILLHKFYYAVGLGIAFRETRDLRYLNKWIALTSSWIDEVEPEFLAGRSLLNGDKFAAVTGRRIQNWIYALYYFVSDDGRPAVPAEFHRRVLVSLHAQVNHLRDHLAEARNHRTLELYAIFLAAMAFPEMKGADEWLDFSLREIVANMHSDLLPDGVQCELSTHYHHLVLKNYLCVRRLAERNSIAVPPDMDAMMRKALDFALHVHKPDGSIPALSDGDVGSYRDLLDHGARIYGCPALRYVATKGEAGAPPPCRSKGFRDSGYYVLRSGWGTGAEAYDDERYLIFDCGPLGAGTHGHFDLLSIEVAAYGRSLVVDPGRYTYSHHGETDWRACFRGTAYHNTVLVDGMNQTAYAPGKKRYKISGPAPDHELRAFASRPGFDYLHGIARSYEYDAVHERKILFVCPEYWIVADLLRANRTHRYDLLFHLSDDACDRVVTCLEAGTRSITAPHLVLAQPEESDVSVVVDDGFVSPRYGKKLPAPVVRYSRHGRNAAFHTVLYPYRDEPPEISIREMAVWADDQGRPVADAQAFCITIERGDERFTDYCFLADSAPWRRRRFGAYVYDGSYLVMRLDAEGKVVRLHTSEGASLESSGSPVRPPDTTP